MAIKFFHCSIEYVYIAGSKNTHVSNKFHLTANQWNGNKYTKCIYIIHVYKKEVGINSK